MNSKLISKLVAKQATHNFLHHIAEEELIACKVTHVEYSDGYLVFTVDCADRPRKEGRQDDLSDKLKLRLDSHKIDGLPRLKCKVIHRDTIKPAL